MRQIIDLRDTYKSRYFAITKYNNCFKYHLITVLLINSICQITRCLLGEPISHFRTRAQFQLCMSMQNIIGSKSLIIICGQLFAGHMVSSRPMKSKEKTLNDSNNFQAFIKTSQEKFVINIINCMLVSIQICTHNNLQFATVVINLFKSLA